MARPLGSGPIHVYIGLGPPSTRPYAPAEVTAAGALYYGTTREGPDIDPKFDFYPVMNDLTGPKQSLDDGFAGREDTISLVMTSRNQAVDNALDHFLDFSNARNARGTDDLADLGTLMLSEGKTIGVWLVKAAAGKAINVAAGMPLGRYYMTCILKQHKPVEGNKENMYVTTFVAKKDLVGINTGKLKLYREDDAAFTSLPAPTFG